jgi:hypothetical protein
MAGTDAASIDVVFEVPMCLGFFMHDMHWLDANAGMRNAQKFLIDVVTVKIEPCMCAACLQRRHAPIHHMAQHFTPTEKRDAFHASVIYRSRVLHVRKIARGKSDVLHLTVAMV